MHNYDLYFGCAHTQFHPRRHLQFEHGYPSGAESWEAFVERSFVDAAEYLDFYPIIYYPAYTYRIGGEFMTESVGPKDEFAWEWEQIKRLSRAHHRPGKLVTFPGYEWTGDRRRWGDHNVIFFDEDSAPLDLSMDVRTLFSRLAKVRAIAVPHHTGYKVGYRGKDWDVHDPDLSPIVEIFSTHGSSEAVDAPCNMRQNPSMSPRVSGGTVRDGLERGLRFGIIASGDNGSGFAGRWGRGLAAVWASELSREGIWEALTQRRTYGVTGDRIRLAFEANGEPMGSEIVSDGNVSFSAAIEASDSIDRVELIRDGRVVDTRCHRGCWDVPRSGTFELKLRVEFGWGPPPNKGVDVLEKRWHGTMIVERGSLSGLERCFTRGGQHVDLDERRASWRLTTGPNTGPRPDHESQQALVFAVRGTRDTEVRITSESAVRSAFVSDLCRGAQVIVHPELSKRFVTERFGLDEYENQPQKEYANAHKTLIHRAVPETGFRLDYRFVDDPPSGDHSYYLRVSQDNGQMAWSSPVWVRRA